MNYLVNLEGLSKIEIIKYLYVRLKHIYPEKIKFYINIFYLPDELINYIFNYLISNQICSIGKIVYLHLYNKNLIIPYYYQEYMDYFNKYKKQILWYYRGLDNFFYNRRVVKQKLFPVGWVYSFNHGYLYPQDTTKHVFRDLPYVCIFDSMGKSEDVKF